MYQIDLASREVTHTLDLGAGSPSGVQALTAFDGAIWASVDNPVKRVATGAIEVPGDVEHKEAEMAEARRLVPAATAAALAVSTIATGATGQDDVAPVELTAEWGFTGSGCCIEVEPASDARFLGDVSASVYVDSHAVDGGSLAVWSRSFDVVNDEGSWRGVPHSIIFHPDGTASDVTQVFIGEGAYDGLYAVVETETTPGAGGGVVLDGYIIEGTAPTQLP